MLYELVAGHPPFDGRTTSDIVANVLHVEPPPLERFAHDCPPELQRIVSKCLRKDRGHRYQTMRDVALDLEALGDTLRGEARRGRRPRRTGGRPATLVAGQRQPVPVVRRGGWAWLECSLALAAGGIAWLVGRVNSPEATRSRAPRQLVLKRLTFRRRPADRRHVLA